MTSKLIRDSAIIHAGISIDAVYSRRWQNEAMDILAKLYDTARVLNTTTMTVTDASVNQTIPTGCMGISKIRYSDGGTYKRYVANRSYMRFYDTGTFTVEYFTKPSNITGDSTVPEIDELYHQVLAYYEAAQELSRINPKHPKIPILEQKFYDQAAITNAAIKNMKSNDKRIAVRLFR